MRVKSSPFALTFLSFFSKNKAQYRVKSVPIAPIFFFHSRFSKGKTVFVENFGKEKKIPATFIAIIILSFTTFTSFSFQS